MKTKLFLVLCLSGVSLFAGQGRPNEPKYTSDGQLILPENYREWVYLSSGLGMTYGLIESLVNSAMGQHFDNVFVAPDAYRSFLQAGVWPDKTVFVKEVRTSQTKGSLNKGGHFQEELVAIEAHVKDQSRFPSKSEFFVFGTRRTAKPLGPKSGCQACHSQHGAVDSTFVQFYPTLLPVAKAKGTLKRGSVK